MATPAPELARFSPMIRRLLCALAAAIIILLCHRGGLDGPFVLDDVAAVTENPSVTQAKSWPEMLRAPSPAPTAGQIGRAHV